MSWWHTLDWVTKKKKFHLFSYFFGYKELEEETWFMSEILKVHSFLEED